MRKKLKQMHDAVAINQRRSSVADFYVRGLSQTDIAIELGICQATVSNDLKAIQETWRESSMRDFDARREFELRKLDRLECEAWTAWEASKKPSQSATVTTSGNGTSSANKTRKTLQDQNGDPRYLDQVHKCIASRRALLGLDLPQKVALTSPDGEETYHARVMSELMRLAEKSDGGPDVVDGTAVQHALESHDVTELSLDPREAEPVE